MLSNHQLDRIRRQVQRRIRLLLAQRRVDAAHYPARRLADPPPGTEPSGKPAREH